MKNKIIIAAMAGLAILAPSMAMACGGKAAMQAADTDGSMSLSEAEYISFAKTQFSLIDKNKDRQIGIQEYKGYKKECRSKSKKK